MPVRDTAPPRPATAEAAFAELGRIPLADSSMTAVLQQVADLAQAVVPGRPEVSVTMLVDGVARTAVHTDARARELDGEQYRLGHGPCMDAASGGQLVLVPDFRRELRWPEYAPRVVASGVLSSLSVPLPVQERIAAAMNLYSTRAEAFDAEAEELATRFAAYAAVAVSNVRSYEDMRGLALGLQTAMESRSVIDQAKGVLIERFRLTADQAFRMLAASSMATNTKLRDVADHLVATGELPVPPVAQEPARRRTPRPRAGR